MLRRLPQPEADARLGCNGDGFAARSDDRARPRRAAHGRTDCCPCAAIAPKIAPRGAYTEDLRKRIRVIRDRYGLASAHVDYRPELWEDERQGELFEMA